MDNLCVLIPSDDSSFDISQTCSELSKAQWPWPVYRLHGAGTWRERTIAQLDCLPEHYDRVLTVVDDVVLNSIKGPELKLAANVAERFDLASLRLTPVVRNPIGRLFMADCEWFFHKLNKSEPYYSSWLIAIWRRTHLRSLLVKCEDVYQFEHMVPSEDHYAVVRPILDYDCIVSNRIWDRRYVKKYKLPLTRPIQTKTANMRRMLSDLSFALFGFTSFRVRRWLGVHVRRAIYK